MSIVHIYGLVDPRTNEIFYIGYSNNIEKRFLQHLNTNGRKREKNLYKDNVINSIIRLNLKPKIKIIDECNFEYDESLKMYKHEILEKHYIEKYRNDGVKLTNLTDGGDGGCTYHRKVYQYTEEGIFMREYSSIKEIAEYYGVNDSLISKVINQRVKKSYRGTYLFSSKNIANSFVFKKTKKDNISIMQYSLNGDFITEHANQYVASKVTNIHQSNISYCLNGKRNSAGGFFWQYKK